VAASAIRIGYSAEDPQQGTAIVLSGGNVLVGTPEEALNLAAWLYVMASDIVRTKAADEDDKISKPEMEGMFLDLCDKIRGK
jgi:hypothetical protein